MKFLVIFSILLIFVNAKSWQLGRLDFGNGKIIGGEDAPARKLCTVQYKQTAKNQLSTFFEKLALSKK